MKLTKAQLEALAQGVEMTVVLAMATDPGAGPEQADIDAVEALTANLTTANAEKDALTTQLATATAENVTLTAQLAEQTAASEKATAESATLRSIVENQVTQLSIAAGSKFDSKDLDAAALIAKHAEMTAAVKDKFKNVTIANTKPSDTSTIQAAPAVSTTRLAKAAKFKIVN